MTRQFDAQFKQDAVNHYNSSGKSLKKVAADLKVGESTLGKWVAAARDNNGVVDHRGSGNYSSDAEKEIARLKKELRDSQDALEVLKKAMSILSN
ncbi:transposase [Virgibacillus halodenitrificans]|uniref:transposase n=1 Tax=Virgibacillus halodenitrificans TaxID=1482 RepID=UPI001370445B|nr:transposase [Virgibacillus halodenitrificans]MCG1028472.1 transposase [Virgibacillus halodenitrificans]MCG1028476.1 transposase [Virgibacillus halodenitrificans]MYL58015.1 transposase [Virgibacillus halodenitrificans]